MNIKRLKRKHDIAWITETGEFDYSKYPIEHPIKDAFSVVEQKFIDACSILGYMAQEERIDAGTFLIGLILYYKEDIERVEILMESLKKFKNALCTDFLFDEIMHTESTIENSRYINLIIETLAQFPGELIKERIVELSNNERFSLEVGKRLLTSMDNSAKVN